MITRIGFRRVLSFRPRSSAILCTSLLLPMGVALEVPSDSTVARVGDTFERVTRLTFGAGSGTYGRTVHDETTRAYFLGYDDCGEPVNQTVTYNADFRHKQEFNDYGGELDIQLSEHGHLGL